MADNEDDSGSSGTITVAEAPAAAAAAQTPEDPSASAPADHSGRPPDSVPAAAETLLLESGSGSGLSDLFQRGPEEQSIVVGAELTALGPDTTIIYVQPDGSLVQGSELTAEEHKALLEQLTRQQLVQVSDTEAAQLLQQSQLQPAPVHTAALDPSQLQQVINQVARSKQQVHVQVPQEVVKQQVQVPQKPVQVIQPNVKSTEQNNASQQLKSVAQQVAMKTSGSVQVVQKMSEPVRIQIQVPQKQELKSSSTLQEKTVCVSHPQVKLSANGSAQIIHIQPVVGQQGQQFFLQQSPGDSHFQVLLQSPAPVVGSLLPLVHKLTGQTTSVSTPSASCPKPILSPSGVKSTAPSTVKTPPVSTSVTVAQTKNPSNGSTTQAARKTPVKPATIITAVPVQTSPHVQSSTVTTPAAAPPQLTRPAAREREKEKEEKKKVKKREKKVTKVQTRSGRVSRPPKYKAKDYKFIKTEDLAESHQSDSDDYSDMSVEEEEGEGARKDGQASGASASLTYSHKSRSHRCQTCDKAYIGPGGLNRHYKLNPTHGDAEKLAEHPGSTPHALRDPSQSHETTGVTQEKSEDKAAAVATNKVEGGSAAAVGLRCLHHRGPGRPRGRGRGRGWGRGRGRSLAPPPKVMVGHGSRRGRRGRPPKLNVTTVTSEQQVERRRDRLQELVGQCEDEELMDIVLPRLTKVLSLWELLLAKVECGSAASTRFPDIYREYESLQVQVKQAALDYIVSPHGGATPLEVRNIEVAKSLGILDEVNRMKVVPGATPSSSLTNKNVRYMENSKMLPPSKRFKMENSIPVHQNGIEMHRTVVSTVTAVTPVTTMTPVSSTLKSCSVSMSPLVVPDGSKLLTTAADSASSSSGFTSAKTLPTEALPTDATMVTSCEDQGTDVQEEPPPAEQEQENALSSPDAAGQSKEPVAAMTLCPETVGDTETLVSGSVQTPVSTAAQSLPQQRDTSQSVSSTTVACEAKELQEGQEIYIQTEGLTVELADPRSDRIVIVNGPDGTTMHIQTPEGVPLEAVQALLGIEAGDGTKAPQ